MTIITKKCKVFPALHGESDKGWIWMPKENGFESMDYVKLTNLAVNKNIFCICRTIDRNFKCYYKRKTDTSFPNDGSFLIVISDHYRRKLGIENIHSPSEDSNEKLVELRFATQGCWVCRKWYCIIALLGHPDPCVKMAIFLAILSIILAILSIIVAFL
jgi:hypothetical protein